MYAQNMRKIGALCFLTVLCGLFLCACQAGEVIQEEIAGETVTVTDSRCVEVTVPYPCKRIVCTLNSALNDLYMLGASDAVVGIDQWTYNTGAVYAVTSKIDGRVADKSLPAVDGSVENIAALNPDVVVLWAESEEIPALEARGISVIGMQINDFDQVNGKLELLGAITGKEDRAAEIIAYCDEKLADLEETLSRIPESDKKPSLFMWGEAQYAGNDSTGNSILLKSGLTNVASSVALENFPATMEQIIDWNPDALVMWNSDALDPDDIKNDSLWKDVAAVQNDAVLELPSNFYCDLWTVKYLNSINIIAHTFYPELFENKDILAEEAAFIKFLYNMEL